MNGGPDRVPRSGVTDGAVAALAGVGPGGSAGKSREADDGIIAQGSDGFQRHVAGALDGPFIVLFEQDGADETDVEGDRETKWTIAEVVGDTKGELALVVLT